MTKDYYEDSKDKNYDSDDNNYNDTERNKTINNDLNSSSSAPLTSNDKVTRKHVLVLVNPVSGTGKSISICNNKLLPILDDNKITFEKFTTENNFRVKDYIKELSVDRLKEFSAIVVVAGDGLFYETVNALFNQKHTASLVSSIPLGIVPTGSGNGLAYTLIKRHYPKVDNLKDAINIACKQIVDFKTSRTDLVKISIQPKIEADIKNNSSDGKESTIIWSFLSFGWGLLADIDIESEPLRKLGELRFTIYGLLKCVFGRTLNGRLSYLPASNTLSSTNSKINTDNNWIHIEDSFTCVYAVYQSHISKNSNFSPKSTLCDELIYLTFVRGKLSCSQTASFLTKINDGSHSMLPYVTVVAVKEFKLEPLEQSRIVIDGEDIGWKLADGPLSAQVQPSAITLLTTP